MLGLALIGFMLSAVSSQDLIGVNYSFDVDFERTFNNKTCATDENWILTDYKNLEIAVLQRSHKGIRSKRASCTSSFPIVFFNNSVLELNIFLQVIKDDSGLITTIFDENSIATVTYPYNKSNINFKPGWNTISIAINSNINGYINLIGRSHDNEIVLVDSFQYITSSKNRQINDKSNIFKMYEPDTLMENVHEPLEFLFDDEGSGEEGSGEEEFDDLVNEDFEDENDVDIKGITKIED